MKSLLPRLLVLFFGVFFSLAIQSQSYPTKPLRMVVTFPAGGPLDIVARMISGKLGEALGQSVIIDNRGGAGGTIGIEHVTKSAPDGYTFVLSSTALGIFPHVYANLPFDVLRDLAPVSLVSTTPELMVVHPSIPAKNANELVALAKAKPGELNGASTGSGGLPHLALELFKLATGAQIVHVPFGGAAPALTNTLGGHTQIMVADVPVLLAHVQTQKLRAVGTTSHTALLPEVLSFSEQGIGKVDAANWYGIFLPGKTPREIIDKLNVALNKALSDKDLRERMVSRGADPSPGTSEQLGALLKSDFIKWGPVVKAAHIKVD